MHKIQTKQCFLNVHLFGISDLAKLAKSKFMKQNICNSCSDIMRTITIIFFYSLQMMSCNNDIHVQWIRVLFSAVIRYICDISVRDHSKLIWVWIIGLHHCWHSWTNKKTWMIFSCLANANRPTSSCLCLRWLHWNDFKQVMETQIGNYSSFTHYNNLLLLASILSLCVCVVVQCRVL